MNPDYAIVAALAALVGIAELITRYRDAPSALGLVPSAWFYVLVNAAGAMAALLAINTFGWTFGGKTEEAIKAYKLLVAAFGSAALFRSAFFLVKIGGRDVGVGPSLILTGLLEAADRGVDRVRGARRAAQVTEIMLNISFEKSYVALPICCLALLQNASAEEQLALRSRVDSIKAMEMLDDQKSLALGLAIINLGGAGVLSAAVAALGDEIKRDKGDDLPPAEPEWAGGRKLKESLDDSDGSRQVPVDREASPEGL
jgi:hypothetical protein